MYINYINFHIVWCQQTDEGILKHRVYSHAVCYLRMCHEHYFQVLPHYLQYKSLKNMKLVTAL